MTAVAVRRAGIDDARALGRIYFDAENAWRRECYPGGVPRDWFELVSPAEAGRSMAAWMDSAPDGAAFFVAEAEGEAVGWAYAAPSEGGWLQLHALYVTPGRWRSGIGAMLLDAVEAWARGGGYSGAWLWAVETNPRSRAFYERFGWSADGSVDRRDGHPPLVRYVRELGAQSPPG